MNQKQYCTQQLQSLTQEVRQQPPFSHASEETPLTATDQRFMDTLEQLASCDQHDEPFFEQAQWLIAQCVANQTHLTALIPRDLFWYFGGECLHYMPDEEITKFQLLEEACFDNPNSNYQDERARIFGLH